MFSAPVQLCLRTPNPQYQQSTEGERCRLPDTHTRQQLHKCLPVFKKSDPWSDFLFHYIILLLISPTTMVNSLFVILYSRVRRRDPAPPYGGRRLIRYSKFVILHSPPFTQFPPPHFSPAQAPPPRARHANDAPAQ